MYKLLRVKGILFLNKCVLKTFFVVIITFIIFFNRFCFNTLKISTTKQFWWFIRFRSFSRELFLLNLKLSQGVLSCQWYEHIFLILIQILPVKSFIAILDKCLMFALVTWNQLVTVQDTNCLEWVIRLFEEYETKGLENEVVALEEEDVHAF